jgi:hypothetical protein
MLIRSARVPRILLTVALASTVAACDSSPGTGVMPSEGHSRLETPQWTTVGVGFRLVPPGGSHPQNAYVTVPEAEILSDVARAELDPPGLWIECDEAGEAWIRVFTENGYWKIYPLTCTAPLHDQGGGN